MDRKKFSGILDEAVGQLENEVRVLKNQQATIKTNLIELENKRNKLSQEIYDLEKKKEVTIKETQDEKERILKIAQDKLNNATTKDAEASGKLSELKQKEKDAEDIVKSNQGLQKNLNLQREDIKNKTIKLQDLIISIEETLKDM
jgi:chromosome segregation ATPase